MMDQSKVYIEVRNCSAPVGIREIPVLDYGRFYDEVCSMLRDERFHCLTYFCYPAGEFLKFICFIADDGSGTIRILSHEQSNGTSLRSITSEVYAMHIFEREIHENHGVVFDDHPWLKPVRYPHDRADGQKAMDDYPFYEIEGEELHEVGVGPVHAGVIEPGHFRFICNGEKVLHLEIQLGYQHRGIERLLTESGAGLRGAILSEDIAGDTAVGHALAHAQLLESLALLEPSASLQAERCIALELERIAVHIGDTAALCADVAYQLGQVACEALRTMVINTTQYWCGNRFGKSMIRPGGTNFPLTEEIAGEILAVLEEVERRYGNVVECVYNMPSVLGRFEDIGTVTRTQAVSTGAVGMAARTCGVPRDIRSTHPFQHYRQMVVAPVMLESGDVLARGRLRALEVSESVKLIRRLTDEWRIPGSESSRPRYDLPLTPGSAGISVTEGWRGEICHVAITDSDGRLQVYKIKDPSMHNWMALALAVRNQEISDFPVCNKSFNLSYCGHDL
ncbi:MAG: NADH-quinone oxidoreductase subunit C [Bacteroidales bacterium]|nr:NADH-quinone oxidoreductase subunit C [Bacteroidales bacterium]